MHPMCSNPVKNEAAVVGNLNNGFISFLAREEFSSDNHHLLQV